MSVLETIAIIGASGKMGRAIALALAGGPYRLLLMGRDEERLRQVMEVVRLSHEDSDMITCAMEACWEADMIVLAAPYHAEQEIADYIRPVATGKIVISIARPPVPADTDARATLQQLLPHARVYHADTPEALKAMLADPAIREAGGKHHV